MFYFFGSIDVDVTPTRIQHACLIFCAFPGTTTLAVSWTRLMVSASSTSLPTSRPISSTSEAAQLNPWLPGSVAVWWPQFESVLLPFSGLEMVLRMRNPSGVAVPRALMCAVASLNWVGGLGVDHPCLPEVRRGLTVWSWTKGCWWSDVINNRLKNENCYNQPEQGFFPHSRWGS